MTVELKYRLQFSTFQSGVRFWRRAGSVCACVLCLACEPPNVSEATHGAAALAGSCCGERRARGSPAWPGSPSPPDPTRFPKGKLHPDNMSEFSQDFEWLEDRNQNKHDCPWLEASRSPPASGGWLSPERLATKRNRNPSLNPG